MKLTLRKLQAIAILGRFFHTETETVNEDGVAWLDVADTLGWVMSMSLEFLDEGETPPPILLSTGASLCYVRAGWSFRLWIEGTEAQITDTLAACGPIPETTETPETLPTAA
jgi:hypothetical protein